MQSPDEIKREIAQIEAKVQEIAEAISTKEKELEKQTQHHSELLIRHLDKKHKPRCIETAHRLAKRLEDDLAALRHVTGQMVGKLDETRTRLALAEIYEGQVKEYQRAKSSFFGQVEAIRSSANELNEQILALKRDINAFLDGARNPLDLLEDLTRNPLLRGLSLPEFVDGRLEDAKDQEDGAYLQAVASEFKELADGLPKPEYFEEIWTLLVYRLHSLSGQADSLIPRHMKYATPSPGGVRRDQSEGSTVIRMQQPKPDRPLTTGELKAKEARQGAVLSR